MADAGLPDKTVHYFSQFIYLNMPPGAESAGVSTVGEVADFYLLDPVGEQRLEERFGAIPAEYGHWKQMLADVPGELREWRIANVLDDNAPRQTGFYGCAFCSPKGEKVVAFRGSECLGDPRFRNDWATDFSLLFCGKTSQQTMVDLYWSKYLDYFSGGGGFWITGHSLGGNLAAYGAFAAPEDIRRRISGCLSFNSPGFCPVFLEPYSQALKDLEGRMFFYQNHFDIISSLLSSALPPRIIASLFDPGKQEPPTLDSLFYPHSNFMFETDEDGVFVPSPMGRKSPLCEMAHDLSEMLLLLPLENRKELAGRVLDAVYGGGEPKAAVLSTLTDYLRQNPSVGAGVQPLTAVAFAARMLDRKQDLAGILHSLNEGGKKPGLGALAKAMLILLDYVLPRKA